MQYFNLHPRGGAGVSQEQVTEAILAALAGDDTLIRTAAEGMVVAIAEVVFSSDTKAPFINISGAEQTLGAGETTEAFLEGSPNFEPLASGAEARTWRDSVDGETAENGDMLVILPGHTVILPTEEGEEIEYYILPDVDYPAGFSFTTPDGTTVSPELTHAPGFYLIFRRGNTYQNVSLAGQTVLAGSSTAPDAPTILAEF